MDMFYTRIFDGDKFRSMNGWTGFTCKNMTLDQKGMYDGWMSGRMKTDWLSTILWETRQGKRGT
jgi:hypothetical protein